MDDHVVGALHEGGVDREERLEVPASPGRRQRARRAPRRCRHRSSGPDAPQNATRPVPVGIAAGDRHNLLVRLGEFRERLAEELGIGRGWRRRGLAAFGLEFAEPVELVRLFQRRRVAFALLGQNVQQDRFVLRLQKLEGPDKQGNVMAIDRPVVAQAELLEHHARQQQVFDARLDFVGELCDGFAAIDSTNCAAFSCRCAYVGGWRSC